MLGFRNPNNIQFFTCKVYKQIPETFKILVTLKFCKFFTKHMTEPKLKMFIFELRNKKKLTNDRGRLFLR